jgi:hypothetical protein
MVEGRGDRGSFPGSIVGAQATLHAIDNGLGHLAKVCVAIAVVILQAGVRNVLKIVSHE